MTSRKPAQTGDRGFTLIEMVVVIAVLGTVALLVLPRLTLSEEVEVRRSARSLAATLRYVQDRAAATRNAYALVFNITGNRITVREPLPVEGGGKGDPFLSRPLLSGSVQLDDVTVSPLGKITAGEVEVPVAPGGIPGVLTVHLASAGGESRYTVVSYPASRKVTVLEGYREGGL